MRLLLFSFVFVGVLLTACAPSSHTAASEQAATDAALAWLALLDEQAYASSWAETSRKFQAQVSAGGWAQTMRSVMADVLVEHPTLDLTQRQLITARYTNTLPNEQPGDYVIVQFETATAEAVDVLETLALRWEDDSWKVQGYYIMHSDA